MTVQSQAVGGINPVDLEICALSMPLAHLRRAVRVCGSAKFQDEVGSLGVVLHSLLEERKHYTTTVSA